MSIPVYKLFLFKPKLDAVQLPKEQQAETMQKMEGFLQQSGGQRLITGEIFSDEKYQYWGVEKYPSWQALLEYDRCLRELGWYQHIDSETYLGGAIDDMPVRTEPLPPPEHPEEVFYKIFLSRYHGAYYDLTDAQRDELYAFNEEEEKLGAMPVLVVYCANETWDSWGVERIPNMETLEKTGLLMYQKKWHKYLSARTYLGTATEGTLIK